MDNTVKSKAHIELDLLVDNQIKRFNRQRYKLKRVLNLLVICQSVFAAATTILIAIDIKFNIIEVSMAAIVSSALSGLSTVFLSKFMFQERLTSHINTVTALKKLQSSLNMKYLLHKDNGIDFSFEKIEFYFEEFQSILDISNNKWNKLIDNYKKNRQGA